MPVPRISKEDLKLRLESQDAAPPVLLDVRLKYPYEHSTVRLPGAVRMLPGEVEPSQLPRDRDIVAYDSDPDEIVSARVVADLIDRGFKAFALRGGLAAWMGASYPTESKEAPRLSSSAPAATKG